MWYKNAHLSRHRTARVLIYTHRWLGIALGVLFVVWFASGIVMMYARMPALDPGERLSRLPAINRVDIQQPPPNPGGEVTRFTLTTLQRRPVYRITSKGVTQSFLAETGEPLGPINSGQAVLAAQDFYGIGRYSIRYDERLDDADQWSFGVRGRMPLHRIRVDDPDKTMLYVAENGEVVLKTTKSGRFWGWTGAVLHWLYFTPLRRQSALWNESIVWLSIAGTLMCVVGVAWGVWRFSPVRGYRLRRQPHWSPYAGWMRWHHYAGLIFGLVTTTWIFSGLLSMDPWNWHPSTSPTREMRQRVSGGAIDLSALTTFRIRETLDAFPAPVKELEFVRFEGHDYAVAASGIVSIDEPHRFQERFSMDAIASAASIAMPDVKIAGSAWLSDYDAYYYDRDRRLSLPVLRVDYGDPQHTSLYFDPKRGTIARKEETLTRVNRWLYHGFHSLDFPFLYYKRPLWDIVVIVLSLGGIVLSMTTLTASWRRVKRGLSAGSRS